MSMNMPLQHEALSLLSEVWALSPEVRLGQLLAHVGFLGEVYRGKGLGYIEDEEILTVPRLHLEELQARLSPSDAKKGASPARSWVSVGSATCGPGSSARMVPDGRTR
jgi:hypothetical protein